MCNFVVNATTKFTVATKTTTETEQQQQQQKDLVFYH